MKRAHVSGELSDEARKRGIPFRPVNRRSLDAEMSSMLRLYRSVCRR